MFRLRFLTASAILAAALVWPGDAAGQIGFADNEADRVRLWNADYFELAMRKADGRLIYITDKTTGAQVSPGNVHGPWVLRFSDDSWLDGEDFSPTDPSRLFSYSWDAPSTTLTLSYHATGTYACDVTISIAPTDGPEVDTTLSIANHSSHAVELLAYPVHLSFSRGEIEGVFVPYQEGIRLLPSFFDSYDFGSRYPGQMFADFAYTDLSVGSFAVYLVQDRQIPLKTSNWLILRDDTYAGGVAKYHHDYDVEIGSTEQWTSPTTVLSVGAALDEAMAAYWTRSGHDAMPTLEDKLGAALREQLARAVLLKCDFQQGSWTFASFQSFLDSLPTGNLLHLVAFWPNGFDEYYPDYLPPNAALGTQSELQNLVAYARSAGHLVMPYTNPTWWDDQSPTLASLGTGIVARDRTGSLIYETYNGHGGYVVTPQSPAVITRQDQTRDEFTLTVPCDFLFEDQIGARGQPSYDGNPAAPDPTQYTQGLIDVAARSAQRLPIMTEGGFDRLAWFESGYCNSQTIGWHPWPSGTYTPYPMAPLWAHENLIFHAHNLAGATMANDLPALTYHVSMGYSLAHDLSLLDLDWLELLDAFQKHFVSTLVGAGMTFFENLAIEGQTCTVFGDGTVLTANLTPTGMSQDEHVIAADGFLAESNGAVIAGVLTTLNGQALAGSTPHYLIFERADYRITIRQPRGDDGDLTLLRPSAWGDDSRIRVFAVTEAGSEVARPRTIGASTIQFEYVDSIMAQPVAYFVVAYCRLGDADCDGGIDWNDQLALTDCLAGPDTSPVDAQACLEAFDCDADLDVDIQDFVAFQRAFDSGS